MLDKTPDKKEMVALIGQPLYAVWQELCAVIDEKYDMECLWNNGGKAWTMPPLAQTTASGFSILPKQIASASSSADFSQKSP